MVVSIENAHLRVTADTLGAQLLSVLGKDGCEYLWQGDPAYWKDRAPVLFPFIARLENKQYQTGGQSYPMTIHGFASKSEFSAVCREDALVMTLCSSEQTREYYPFDFTLEITYRLEGSTLLVENRVTNEDTKPMHFALGGHPGFCVPLGNEGRFQDCYLEFSAPCAPVRIGFTQDTVLRNSQDVPYPLEDGRSLPLDHSLFDDDAIILKDVAPAVSLKSHACGRSVTVRYPDMPYLGFWHRPHSDAPYVCIEPWTSLPGRSGLLEDIDSREDFIHLDAGKTWENIWTVSIG